jgi:hypothetical protein
MGSIQIFSLEFSGLKFACARDFTGVYHFTVGDHAVSLVPDAARFLATGGENIRIRARVASQLHRDMKPGAAFRRTLQAVGGPTVHLEFGVVDASDGLYIEIGATRVALTDAQGQLLLAVLGQLGDDVSSVYRATAVPDDMRWGVAPGLRGPGLELPDWADDTK